MYFKKIYALSLTLFLISFSTQSYSLGENYYNWIGTYSIHTNFGVFDFENGYPRGDTAERLFRLRTWNRAVQVYLTQLMAVSARAVEEGLQAFGAKKSNQLVIWEQLMDPATVLLTGNTETVYAAGTLDLKTDGPTVIEAPANMLGFLQDALQRYLADIGFLGEDKGQGGKFLILPPDFKGNIPSGYFVVHSPTYTVMLALRGFQVNNKPDQAVQLMKKTKIYPLASASTPPAMEFMNGSKQAINTVFPDNAQFYELLARLVNAEPADIFSPYERADMQAIGIEKGKPFNPDNNMKGILQEAAQIAAAMTRANSFTLQQDLTYYPNQMWQAMANGMTYKFELNGIPQIDARDYFYYIAIGNTPAMMEKNIDKGSQYLLAYQDTNYAYLDGAKKYKLHIPPHIPVKNFWSIVVYDTRSRSELQNGQSFPSVNSYTHPKTNADGSIDIFFSPNPPQPTGNWIKTLPGKGWFTLFRFYGPTAAYFDKTWMLPDIKDLDSPVTRIEPGKIN